MSDSKQKQHAWEDELQEIQDLMSNDQHTEARERGEELGTNPHAPRYYQIRGMILASHAEHEYGESFQLYHCADTLYAHWKVMHDLHNPGDGKMTRIWKRVEEQLAELLHSIKAGESDLDLGSRESPSDSDDAIFPGIKMPEDAALGYSAITMIDIPPSGSPEILMIEHEHSSESEDSETSYHRYLGLRPEMARRNLDEGSRPSLVSPFSVEGWRGDPPTDTIMAKPGPSNLLEDGPDSSFIGPGQRVD